MEDHNTLLNTKIETVVIYHMFLLPNCQNDIYRRAMEYEKKQIEAGLIKYQLYLNNAKCNLCLLFCLKSTKVVIEDIENVIINFMRLNAYPPKVIEPPKPLDHDDLYD